MASPEESEQQAMAEQPQQQPAVENGENAEQSALHTNIKTKGQNSYYYAHKKRDGVEVHQWDGKAAPRLLKSEEINADEVEHVESITNYAWADSKKKVSVYVTLPGIGAHDEELTEINWAASSLDVRIKKYERKTRVLSLKLYDEISDVKIKRKEDQLVIMLQKAKEFTWYSLKKDK